MEIIGAIAAVVIGILTIAGILFDGFSVWNYVQFFRGKETPLEKMTLRKRDKRKE